MRFTSFETNGLIGLQATTVEFPDLPIVALSGPNGSGKSTMLGALLSPLVGTLHSARDADSFVRVGISLTPEERRTLTEVAKTRDHLAPLSPIPEYVEMEARITPNRITLTSTPPVEILRVGFHDTDILALQPSLNTLVIPAHRRLMPTSTTTVDLEALSDNSARVLTMGTRQNATLATWDDNTFEDFAKALAVSRHLPTEGGTASSRLTWERLESAVNSVISPKILLGLTQENATRLRIQTPDGGTHFLNQLSSGEQQALLIMGVVMRARSEGAIVIIDEPDTHLHPGLAARLVEAILGDGAAGQLFVATHNPAILDLVPPEGIVQLDVGRPARMLSDQPGRLAMYRSLGIRASQLTQHDAFLLVEGTSDAQLLAVSSASLRRQGILCCGGRRGVLSQSKLLHSNDVPFCGVIDSDGDGGPELDQLLSGLPVMAWPASDIEAVFLGAELSLTTMIERGWVRSEFAELDILRNAIQSCCEARRDSVIAAHAGRKLRAGRESYWPRSSDVDPLDALRATANARVAPTSDEIEQAIEAATMWWNENVDRLLRIVPGKAVIEPFAVKCTTVTNGRQLLLALARTQPRLGPILDLEALADSAVARASGTRPDHA